MQHLVGNYKQLMLPLHLSQCEAGAGTFEPAIAAEEAEHVIYSCDNPFRKNIVTCKDEYREEFVSEVEGLDFNTSLNPHFFSLPPYIPIVDRHAFKFSIPNEFSIVATTLRDITGKQLSSYAGSMHEPLNITYSRDFSENNAFKNKKLLIFLTGPDSLIEPTWHQRHSSNLYGTLRKNGVDLVTGFNFSLFKGECAFSQGLNLKKSLYSCYEMEQRGIREVIPHIYAMNDHQLNRWITWLYANPTVQYCTMNCQVQRTHAEISHVVHTVSSLLLKIPYLHIILQGFRFTELYRFGPLLNRIHVADATAIKFAHSRRRMTTSHSISKKPVFNMHRTSNETAIENMLIKSNAFDLIKRQFENEVKNIPLYQINKTV